MALGKDVLINSMEEHRWNELSSLNSTFTDLLRQYYYVGGMPEVVKSYIEKQDIFEVRNIQKQILSQYRRDFSKHIPIIPLSALN